MLSTSSSSSQKAPRSLAKSIGNLPTAIIKKLTGDNKIAPLFITSCAKDEELVELACGHIFRKKDDDKASAGRFGLLGSNSLLANLSIFEATRCPFCESDLVKGAGGTLIGRGAEKLGS